MLYNFLWWRNKNFGNVNHGVHRRWQTLGCALSWLLPNWVDVGGGSSWCMYLCSIYNMYYISSIIALCIMLIAAPVLEYCHHIPRILLKVNERDGPMVVENPSSVFLPIGRKDITMKGMDIFAPGTLYWWLLKPVLLLLFGGSRFSI